MSNFIINHQRFKKQFNQNELTEYLHDENRIKRFPLYEKNYYNFFNTYAKEKYELIKNKLIIRTLGTKVAVVFLSNIRYYKCFAAITVLKGASKFNIRIFNLKILKG